MHTSEGDEDIQNEEDEEHRLTSSLLVWLSERLWETNASSVRGLYPVNY
jgi:hypothetical protein